jgi:hypothetical protein
LWAGSVFNTRPKCEDPLKGEGSTLLWCDILSVTVGLVDIVVVAAIGVCFLYIKVISKSTEAVENEVVLVDSSKKKRRLSSRELMIEMSTQHLQTNSQASEEGFGKVKGGGEDEEGGEGGGEVTVTLGVNPMHTARGKAIPNASETATPNATQASWNKLKHATRTSRMFRHGGKQRMKRLSKVMKARQNESGGVVSMHVDEETGRHYSCNEATGHTQWLSDDDGVNETTHEEAGESKTKTLFRKFVDDDDDIYYENVETGEVIWNLPKDGELMK